VSQAADAIARLIRAHGPLTVAGFMEHALYAPDAGYYALAAQRSGRQGDFFTSVDVGATFGDLLERQVAEMAEALPDGPFDLVEAGAGNGRLSADILRAAGRHPSLRARLRLHLVEASPVARAEQAGVLGTDLDRLASSDARLPESFTGVLLANELLDAMPVHQVVMRDEGLREIYVDLAPARPGDTEPAFVIREGPLSTPAILRHLEAAGAALEPGWRAEVGLAAVKWVRDAARRLRRGFMLLIDYGHEARDLYSASHSLGTLTTFARHTVAGPERSGAPPWLLRPGEQDITAHVDFTSVRRAAEAEGLHTLGLLDQTYFLMGLMDAQAFEEPATAIEQIKRRLALKTLLLPGGLGSTMKVLLLCRGVGAPRLRGCSVAMRMT
jgi:SAM-dependent MidA family methyltransferase